MDSAEEGRKPFLRSMKTAQQCHVYLKIRLHADLYTISSSQYILLYVLLRTTKIGKAKKRGQMSKIKIVDTFNYSFRATTLRHRWEIFLCYHFAYIIPSFFGRF